MDPSSEPPLLLVTGDALVQGQVSRLAAAANVAVEVVEVRVAADRWRTSPAVLVGHDAARDVVDLAPARRDDVWVVASGAAGEQSLRAAVALGATRVVELPADSDVLGAWLGDLGDRSGDSRCAGRVLGVVGASGGVGATVLALAVAEVASRQEPAVLVDLDPWGLPSGVLAGASPIDASVPTGPTTWADLAELEGRVAARALRESLPARDGLRVLGWAPPGPRAPGDAGREGAVAGPSGRVVREVVAAARRGHDWVVLDVPRSDSTRELLALCDAVAVVASPTIAGTAGAARISGLVPTGVAAGVVVRTARGAWPEDVAHLAGLPLWGVLAHQRGLDEHLAAGLGAVRSRRSPCARAAHDVLAAAGAGGRRPRLR